MIINGKVYTIPAIDFGVISDVEEMGIDWRDIQKRPIGFVTAMVAVAMGCGYREAVAEINEHVKAGGDLKDAAAEANEAIRNSDFFSKRTATA